VTALQAAPSGPAEPRRKTRPLTGDEYIESLAIYIYGERVRDVTEHPAFRNPRGGWSAEAGGPTCRSPARRSSGSILGCRRVRWLCSAWPGATETAVARMTARTPLRWTGSWPSTTPSVPPRPGRWSFVDAIGTVDDPPARRIAADLIDCATASHDGYVVRDVLAHGGRQERQAAAAADNSAAVSRTGRARWPFMMNVGSGRSCLVDTARLSSGNRPNRVDRPMLATSRAMPAPRQ
jgi:hypothetical protein